MTVTSSPTSVTATTPAPSDVARAHFAALLSFETDCWDVHHEMTSGTADFVVLDVRSPSAFAAGHVDGSVNLPHATISEATLAEYAIDTIFVVYCNGPHCNGADKAALRLAGLGRPVKKMIGGVEGWKAEGFALLGE